MQSHIYDINRKHKIDNTYFDTIDSEQKAYWLGFIWADGSISKTATRCSGCNRLTISQKAQEIQHIKTLLLHLKSNYPITTQTDKNIVIVDINSRPICQALECLGFGNKSQRIHVPPINQNLIRHFIRGYFDGDGCLSVYVEHTGKYTINRQEWSITGNPVLIQEIKEILEHETDVSQKVKIKTYKRTNKAVSLRYGKKSDIATLYEYLYSDATIFLKSKHQKFISYFDRLNRING